MPPAGVSTHIYPLPIHMGNVVLQFFVEEWLSCSREAKNSCSHPGNQYFIVIYWLRLESDGIAAGLREAATKGEESDAGEG